MRYVIYVVLLLTLALSAFSATSVYVVGSSDLADGKPEFSLPHGTGQNPFGYDWDSQTPDSAIGAPAGFGNSSFYANVNNSGLTAPDRYRTLRIGIRALFSKPVAIKDIKSISYYTKKPAPQTAIDWRISLYTTPLFDGNDSSGWYRNRIQSNPYGCLNLNAPADTWNSFTTDAGTNQFQFGTTGTSKRQEFYSQDITWQALSAGPVTRGTATWDFSIEDIMMLDILLGASSGGGTGESQMDGIRVELNSGEVALIDLSGDDVTVDGVNGNDTTGDGSPANPYKTIQKGVNSAVSGDTIRVLPATYNEAVTINKNGIAVIGTPGYGIKGASLSAPILDGTGKDTVPGIRLTNNASGIIISGLVIQNFSSTSDNVSDTDGILATSNNDNVVISDCSFYNNIWNAVLTWNTGNVTFDNWEVTRNIVMGFGGQGIELYNTTNSSITKNIVDATGSYGACIQVMSYNEGTKTGTVSNVLISGNELKNSKLQFADAGIMALAWRIGTGTNTITDLSITDNVISGNTYGIIMYESNSGTIVNPIITNNSLVGNSIGLQDWTTTGVSAVNNWWGAANGPRVKSPANGTIRIGSGDPLSALVTHIPYLTKPSHNNVVYLEPNSTSYYVKQVGGVWEPVVIDLKVANLQQPIGGVDACLNFSSTYFSTNPADVSVLPGGGGVWDDASWAIYGEDLYQGSGVPGDMDTHAQVYAYSNQTTTADATTAVITLNPVAEGITQVVFRNDDPETDKVTRFTSYGGIDVRPVKVNTATIYLDATAPVVTDLTATENSVNVLNCANNTLQGTVNISVKASDALSLLDGVPTVTVSNGVVENAVYVNESPAGTFNYTWDVTSTTPNGSWTITVTAKDKAGNETVVTGTLCITRLVTGTIELESFAGSSRVVTFVATGSTTKTWNLTLTGWSGGSSAYTLTDVPIGTTAISAKTAWNLREKLAVSLTATGTAVADFISNGTAGWQDATDHYLRGGDINGSNSVNVLDYGVLKTYWYTNNTTADIDGSGLVQLPDYTIIKANWFGFGDPQ